MNERQPFIYRFLDRIGLALQYIGYALVMLGTMWRGGDGAERVEDEAND